ncbi:collagen-like triple helix repeat-containing protein [Cupriavidus basilensis]
MWLKTPARRFPALGTGVQDGLGSIGRNANPVGTTVSSLGECGDRRRQHCHERRHQAGQ